MSWIRTKTNSCMTRVALLALLSPMFAFQAGAVESNSYSRAAVTDIPRQVLWGDTHVHSNLSLDANLSGNTEGPEFAYRFARGDTVVAHNGMPVKLRRPLDFLLVSDHSEYVGVLEGLGRGDELLLEHPTAVRWRNALAAGDPSPMTEFAQSTADGVSVLDHPAFARTVWERMIAGGGCFQRARQIHRVDRL